MVTSSPSIARIENVPSNLSVSDDVREPEDHLELYAHRLSQDHYDCTKHIELVSM